MKPRRWLLGLLFVFVWASPAAADNRFIVRSTLGLQGLQSACSALPLLQTCTVVRGLGDPQNHLFLITSPLDLTTLLNLAGNPLGMVAADLDRVITLVGGWKKVTTPPAGLADTTAVPYYGSNVWDGYANQPAATVVRVSDAHQAPFNVLGTGIVADIDTGVDPNHPALQPVLLPGYDFTRNQPSGSEMTDVAGLGLMNLPPGTTTVFNVNQSTAAVLDQSTAAVLDQTQFAAFGHGTMVLGVVHLVAPKAQLMPLKAFSSDGTANLSDILRAIYYAVQSKANVINMSFETQTSSFELSKALDYANQNNVISAASAGNDGQGPNFLVYPAALQNDVMGVASVGSIPGVTDSTRSTFSNFGNSIVWVAAPGEAIITTYPFSTYSAGWGTSFSAPFVSGAGALLLNQQPATNEFQAATAVKHAVPLTDPDMGNGRLDLVQALQSQPVGTGSDFAVSPSPNNATINAGQPATFTVTATPSGSFTQTVTWSCSGAPPNSTCAVSPSSVPLDGTNPANATVTVTTTARSLLPPAPRIQPRFARPLQPWSLLALCLVWLLAWTMLCNLSRASRRQLGFRAATALLVIALCISCGGGYGGSGSNPSPATLSSVTLNPMSVTGGNSSTGTVTLGGYAPSGGITVSLASSKTAATVPANVTVAAGASTATFTVSTSAVTASTQVTISASYAGVTKTASLTVTPPPGTPAGNYTLTVIGTSGNVSHATTFQLTVN